MLANVSVVALLLAPGEYVLARLRGSFERLERVAEEAKSVADSAKRVADDTSRSLNDVRKGLIGRQYREHESELDIYRAIMENASRTSLLNGLRHATDSGILTLAGVRSPIWETNLHYRYVIDEFDALEVRLETDHGEVLSSHVWERDVPPDRFYQELVQAVREAGHDLGVGLNDPTHSIQDLSEMLIEVAHLRSQELLGHRHTLHRIIERVNGWYFTERYVLPADNLRYEIDVDRLDEVNWEEHLQGKGWHGAVVSIPFARRLYGINLAEPTSKQSGFDEEWVD